MGMYKLHIWYICGPILALKKALSAFDKTGTLETGNEISVFTNLTFGCLRQIFSLLIILGLICIAFMWWGVTDYHNYSNSQKIGQ